MDTPLVWFGGTVKALNEDLAISVDDLDSAIKAGLFTEMDFDEPYETPDGRM
ncbi:hypothetical protein ACIBHY_17080 [Nonomuraea sp. NPDC050547]|uniref:hypothetical protein n=1 Tax=Nonomuraea sp. NPDC050547 TaxID=3364368 RepID=UPI0037A7D9CD